MSPLDPRRLAVRIETLQRTSTSGWHPADELEFRNQLPGARGLNALPDPATIREIARKWQTGEETPDGYSGIECHIVARWVLDLEAIAYRNRPGSPRRLMRDIERGRRPLPQR